MKEKGSLTTGSIPKKLTLLSLPIVATAFLSTAYNIADMAWIGFLGGEALAGVGIGGMYVWFSEGIVTLPRMGGQILVAQSLGAGDTESAEKYATATMWITIVLGLLFGLVAIVFTNPMTTAFGLNSEMAIKSCHTYLRIVCGLSVIPFCTFALTGIYNAQGDSKTPLIANLVGMVLNIVLDPFLIFGIGIFPELGVFGASSATIISQTIVLFILVIAAIKQKSKYNIVKQINFLEKIEKKYYGKVIKLGWPSALQTMVYAGISMFLTDTAALFGEAAIAVFRVGNQIESIAWNIASGFNAAINAFSAQNYGAANMKRVRKGYNFSFLMVAVWGTFVTLLFLFMPEYIAKIFFHTDLEISLAIDYLKIIALGEGLMCIEILSIGAIQGLGATGLCSAISVIVTTARIPIAAVLCASTLGLNGIWWTMTLTSGIKGLIFWGLFHIVCNKKEKEINLGAKCLDVSATG